MMLPNASKALLGIMLGMLWMPRCAFAQPTDADAIYDRPFELAAAADRAYAAGRRAEALRLYQRAEVLLLEPGTDSPDARALIYRNMGRCLESLERHAEAMRAFERAADLYTDPVKSSTAKALAKEMHALLFGDLTTKCGDAPVDRIRVELFGPDGSARPGRRCGEAWQDLPVGTYRVVGITDDDLRAEQTAEVLGRQTTTVQLRFKGGFEVRGPDGLPVTIDDQPAGALPYRRDHIDPRRYRVRVDYPGDPPFTETIDVRPGRRETIIAPSATEAPSLFIAAPVALREADDELRAMLPWVLAAGAIGAGAIGGVFLYSGENNEDKAARAHSLYRAECPQEPIIASSIEASCDIEKFPDQRRRIGDLRDIAVADRTIGYIAIGTSAALLGAATWFLVDDWPAAIGRVEVGADDSGASLLYRGEF